MLRSASHLPKDISHEFPLFPTPLLFFYSLYQHTNMHIFHQKQNKAKIKILNSILLYVPWLRLQHFSASYDTKVLQRVIHIISCHLSFHSWTYPNQNLTLPLTPLELFFVKTITKSQLPIHSLLSLLALFESLITILHTHIWLCLRRPLLTISLASCNFISLCCFLLTFHTPKQKKAPVLSRQTLFYSSRWTHTLHWPWTPHKS